MNRVLYQAVLNHPKQSYDIDKNGNLIILGTETITLVPYHVDGFDFLEEDILQAGSDVSIILPKDEIVAGEILEAIIVNEMTDWETGIIDSWDIELVPCTHQDLPIRPNFGILDESGAP